MASSNRMKGTKLSLSLGTPAVDYWADATSVVMENEEGESDTTTFYDASVGGSRQYFFTVGMVQSTDKTSLWRRCWDFSGEEVPFVYAPHGDLVATPDQPHVVGTVRIGPKPTLGGEAGTGAYTTESRWDILDTPELYEGPEA